MNIQTVFRAGNSEVVVLPKSLGFKTGDKVVVDRGLVAGTAYVSRANENLDASSITPNFLSVLEGVNKRYRKALAELANK